MDTQRRYLDFARFEARGSSPTYEVLSSAVADSPDVLARLDELPVAKRQPNLLLAAARFAEAPIDDPGRFVDFVVSHWGAVAAIMAERSTQTNEPARTATFLPLLAAIEGPIALIEVGCSAGLCLYPDRYSVSYDAAEPLVERSPVRIDVHTSGGVPLPTRLPEVVARIGIDLNPLDITDIEDRAWLDALIWPEHRIRVERLGAASSIVANEPPTLLTGDLVDTIDDAIALAPPGATKVVYHSAVLNYLDPTDRSRFADRVHRHDRTVWFANEAPGVLAGITTTLRSPDTATTSAFFILSEGTTRTLAIADPHGAWLRWTNG